MNKLALFSFVKDEIDFIQDFIDYHSSIFDEITIIDNGSTDGTLEILKNSNINFVQDTSPFIQKGEICSNIMKQSNCDILVPMDADEKIIYDNGNIKSVNKNLIKTYLQNLSITGKKFKIRNVYEYHPDNDGWYGFAHHTKIIFPKDTFMYTDSGFHRGRTTLDEESNFNTDPYYWRKFIQGRTPTDKITNVDISYIHYHFKSKDIWLKNTEKKLRARLNDNWNNLEILRQYSGQSIHCKWQYLKYIDTKNWVDVKKSIFLDIQN